MARRDRFPAVLLVAALAFGGCAASRELDLEDQTGSIEDDSYFDGDLAGYGDWVDVPAYGLVWCPDVASTWQPYTMGYWLYSDDGWFWASEDPWGSVPYHYGRWAFDHDYGWVWVPGDVWAPAWVAWRCGSGWVGWAPLPPEVPWVVHVGIDLTPYDLDRHIPNRRWSFTRDQDFGTQRTRSRVEPFDKNDRLVKETRNVTKYAAGSHPVETGMNPGLLRRGKDVERYRIVDSRKPVPKSGLKIRHEQLEVYRPAVDVKQAIRERLRVLPVEQHEKSSASVRVSDVRDREKPEVRVQQREEVARVGSKDEQIVTRSEVRAPERRESVRERQEPVREHREPIAVSPEKSKVLIASGERQHEETSPREVAMQRRDEVRHREEAAQERENAAREKTAQREEAARQREEAARGREKTVEREKAPEREEVVRAREKNARDQEPETPARESEIQERESAGRKGDVEDRERVAPKRDRKGPAR